MKQSQDLSHEQDDTVLVASALAGDQAAFAILIQRYAPSVQRLCTRLLGTTVEAQDIVQEATLQVFLGLSHLREPARFAAWFHAIAANLARTALRRHSEESLEQVGEEAMTPLFWAGSPATVEESLFVLEMQEAIVQTLRQLSPAHRQAIVGFYLQGYHYAELAESLGIPVSTLKWRLFEGRKLLKTLLQPLAEELLYPVENPLRKEKPMTTGDLIILHLDSLRHVPFTRQYLAILRDSASRQMLPVSLTEAEFNTLEVALHTRQDANAPSVPQDLTQRLLESFGTHLQQVVINALVGQILYTTATFKQGARVRSVDMRLAEALVLVAREDAPISITRTLFENKAAHDLAGTTSPLPGEEPLSSGTVLRKLGREERLQWEEAVRHQYLTTRRKRVTPFWERLWTMMLISLAGSPNALSVAELRTLDPATAFSARQITWDAQPMIALQLSPQEEASWFVISPALWEKITQEWHALRNPEQPHDPEPAQAHVVSHALRPRIQQQVEEMLARLVELSAVRTALLLNPAGKVTAWKGPETQESLQHYSDTTNDLAGPSPAQQREPEYQGQKGLTTFYVKQRPPAQKPPEPSDADRFVAQHQSGWRLMVFFQEPRADQEQAQAHRRIEEIWRAILRLLAQPEQE
jgi:RNA polymerase sigma-70 factor, ECF subfamily